MFSKTASLYFAVAVYEGEQLNLTRISRSEMGAYLCIASNSIPPSVSKRIIVDVECKYIHIHNMTIGIPIHSSDQTDEYLYGLKGVYNVFNLQRGLLSGRKTIPANPTYCNIPTICITRNSRDVYSYVILEGREPCLEQSYERAAPTQPRGITLHLIRAIKIFHLCRELKNEKKTEEPTKDTNSKRLSVTATYDRAHLKSVDVHT